VIRIEIVRLPHGEGLPLPTRATPGSAGFDLASAVDAELAPGERRLIPTGFAVAIPTGYEIQIRPRSGLALKSGVTLPNTPATIDSDYRGELKVVVINLGSEPFQVTRGMRVAQMVISALPEAEFSLVSTLSPTGRGKGGFGSTGSGP